VLLAIRVLVRRVRWSAEQKEKAKDIEARLVSTLDCLKKAAEAAPEDRVLITARNEVVSAARRLDVKRFAEQHRTTTYELENNLTLQVPAGHLWGSPERVRNASMWTLKQDRNALHPLRTVTLADFRWDVSWNFSGGSAAKGDSIKDIGNKLFEVACGQMKTVKARRPLFRATLKGCDPGWAFEVEGTDALGNYCLQRDWLFKSKKGNLTTYRISVRDARPGERDDPELQCLLDLVTEKAK